MKVKATEAKRQALEAAGPKPGTAKERADRFYEDKMAQVFRRAKLLLHPAGRMVVMFNHKQTYAWRALGMALIRAGFDIRSSVPIHTEAESSLNIRGLDAARSTVLLLCMPREDKEQVSGNWAAVQSQVARKARNAAAHFQQQGLAGTDLYLSSLGPAIGVVGEHWPVTDLAGREIDLEDALNESYRAVGQWRLEQLLEALTTDSQSAEFSEAAASFSAESADRNSQALWLWLDAFEGELADSNEVRKLANSLNTDPDGHRVIVFTQYLDTLDFIRQRLAARFGDRMACYSGRGGEIWDPAGNDWRLVDKAEIKTRSKRDHDRAIRILLGTDAASEGLNLQQFSALVNYDLPWNPMRVEQRIGRIDRIGQEAITVGIYNLYLRGTIEEDVYLTLRTRIGLFEEVVGPLQPILAEMPRIMGKVARGEMEKEDAQRILDQLSQQTPNSNMQPLEAFAETSNPVEFSQLPISRVTQEKLAAWCLEHLPPGMTVTAVPEPGSTNIEPNGIRACLQMSWQGTPCHLGILDDEELLVTFNGELADRHPPTAKSGDDEDQINPSSKEGVRLLTWGDPILTSWLMAFAKS